jgi:Trk K+ transport system NAD-binding subunit
MGIVERLAGKVAVIICGASGIGLATARRLVAEGARVVLGVDRLKAAESALSEGMWLAPALLEEFADNAALAAAITPDDVASLVAFLASDDGVIHRRDAQLAEQGRGERPRRRRPRPARRAAAAAWLTRASPPS